ncbi:MAG: ABC transporter ATP-binding protein, partial [Desulfuromonadales bacterium GWD2_61_12]
FRGKKGRHVQALDQVNLTVTTGEVFGFLGPNGAGKSTTIKTLVGMIRPTLGCARLFGQSVESAVARRTVGYLPENPSFYEYLTAREYLELVGRSFSMDVATIRRESARVLELLTLTEAADRPMRGYSKGMIQRLGLAQSLLHDPELYILDEPMSGLDPLGRALVKQVMLDLKKAGKTVFFSTHVIADVEAVCDRVAIIAAGRLQVVYDVAEIMEKGIYGYLVQIAERFDSVFVDFPQSKRGTGRIAVAVARERFREFMERLFALDGQIELIEPQRRSLEELFLEIVDRAS